MEKTETIKTSTPDLEVLELNFNECKNSPWAIFFNLTWSSVIETYNEKGYEVANELIRRNDISAYRAEEASCGCI